MDKSKFQLLIADSESLITFGIIVVSTIILAFIVQKYIKRKLQKKVVNENFDFTSFTFIRHIIVATIYLFGFGWALLSLPISATFAHSLFAGASVSTLILGFSSQQVLSNVMSGIYVVIRKSYKINDVIEFQGNRGKVIEINLNETIIEDADMNKIIIPNSLISNGIIKNISKN